MKCFSGSIPEISVSVILKPGEVAYFSCRVSILAQKTDVSVKRNFIGTRVNFSGMPIYLGRSTPHKESSEVLIDAGSGELVLTDQRIIVVSDKANYNIPLNKVMDFQHYGDAIQIFNEGPHGGIIYRVDNPWRLWVLLFTKLKVEAGNLQLKPSNPTQLEEQRQFVLHVIEEIETTNKTIQTHQWKETFLESDAATFLWLIVCPPVGFYCLWRNTNFGMFTKAILAIVGLYALGKWIQFLH